MVIYIALYTLNINFVFFLHNCVNLFVCLTYSTLCCNRSKSVDSINTLYTFRYLVVSSSLFLCKFIILFMWSFSRSLCALVFVQWKRRWSIVWSSLPQMHVASSLNVCMHVCMYVHTYVCSMYVCTYICMYVCVCVCVCMYICTYV